MAPTTSPGRERLQRILTDLGRRSHRSGRSGRGSSDPRDERKAPPAPDLDRRSLVEVRDRLDRIERRLTDLAAAPDGTPDRFRRWIEEGYWERIRFSEFLRLKK